MIHLLRLASVLVFPLSALLPAQELHDWPQWRGPTRDGVWRETGLVKKLPAKLKRRWTAPIGGGYSGPTIADGRVYVTDRVEDPERERVHCFEWKTGKPVWSKEYACSYAGVSYKAGPRASVLVQDGLAYSLGAAGHLYCFDAATGDVKWTHDLGARYDVDMPIWGIAASPVIEKDLLIVPACGAEALLVAFDRKTGKERWKAFTDRGNYAAPIILDHAGDRVLVCWSGDRILGVDPSSGKLRWEHPYKASRMPLGVADPIRVGDRRLFFSGFYDGSLMLELEKGKHAVKPVWRRKGQNERRTDALHTIISTPFHADGHLYGVCSYGEMRCLDANTGDRVWEDLTAVPKSRWATIHFVQNGDDTWMFNERGELLVGRFSKAGFKERSRAFLIKPTRGQLNRRGGVCWAHPGYAYRHVFARNDEELVCVDLSAR